MRTGNDICPKCLSAHPTTMDCGLPPNMTATHSLPPMTDNPTITPSDGAIDHCELLKRMGQIKAKLSPEEWRTISQYVEADRALTEAVIARHAQQAREEEREACAKEADDNAHEECEVAEAIAAAIRNRTLKDQAE